MKAIVVSPGFDGQNFTVQAERLLAGFSAAKASVVADGSSFACEVVIPPQNQRYLKDSFQSYVDNGFLPEAATLNFGA